MPTTYDLIFTGGGAAALSLLSRLSSLPFWQDKRILIIDQVEKTTNDRTWCFWEHGKGHFEEIVYHRWGNIHFADEQGEFALDAEPYQYKMIRSSDFYQLVHTQCSRIAGFEHTTAQVKEIRPDGRVLTNAGTYRGKHIFNSILFQQPALDPLEYYFMQHFKGWFIETSANVFRQDTAMLMDFRCEQEGGPTFVYVLPVSRTRALVEYTVFSKNLLTPQRYDDGLLAYIHGILKLKPEEYAISEVEYGVIPMTNAAFPASTGKVIHIGTAGGWTKASSGYTFQFIQRFTERMALELSQGIPENYVPPARGRRFAWYDHTLLEIFHQGVPTGQEVFSALFRKNPGWLLFRFLDDETTFTQELRIMSTTKIRHFLPAALRQWWV